MIFCNGIVIAVMENIIPFLELYFTLIIGGVVGHSIITLVPYLGRAHFTNSGFFWFNCELLCLMFRTSAQIINTRF